MPQVSARPVSLGVIRVGEEILVFRGHDPVKNETYYRPLGGTIEFGEHSEAAVRRELREELGVTVAAAQLLGVIENRFVVNGQPGHELDFVYLVSVDELERLRTIRSWPPKPTALRSPACGCHSPRPGQASASTRPGCWSGCRNESVEARTEEAVHQV
jgi:ADP-ribose pyrophosphatase YjhB (NUDIX family)